MRSEITQRPRNHFDDGALLNSDDASREDLDLLLGRYATAEDETSERDKERLHISSIGDCPRMITLRYAGRTIDEAEVDKARRNYMFHLAHVMHDEFYEVLDESGLLLGCEVDVSEWLPKEWTGTLDALALRPRRRIIDYKTAHPNLVRYAKSLPKLRDVQQVLGYEIWAGDALETHLGPEVVYKDRGGQNRIRECAVAIPDDWEAQRPKAGQREPVKDLMARLSMLRDLAYQQIIGTLKQMYAHECARAHYKDTGMFPDILPKAYTMDGAETKITLAPDYRCGAYCEFGNDFLGTEHCSPMRGETGVLKKNDKGVWVQMRNATSDDVFGAIDWYKQSVGEDIVVDA